MYVSRHERCREGWHHAPTLSCACIRCNACVFACAPYRFVHVCMCDVHACTHMPLLPGGARRHAVQPAGGGVFHARACRCASHRAPDGQCERMRLRNVHTIAGAPLCAPASLTVLYVCACARLRVCVCACAFVCACACECMHSPGEACLCFCDANFCIKAACFLAGSPRLARLRCACTSRPQHAQCPRPCLFIVSLLCVRLRSFFPDWAAAHARLTHHRDPRASTTHKHHDPRASHAPPCCPDCLALHPSHESKPL